MPSGLPDKFTFCCMIVKLAYSKGRLVKILTDIISEKFVGVRIGIS